jgi:hypothetical protein
MELSLESITKALGWLDSTSLAVFIRESPWTFPAIEAIHVIALALVVGTIAIIDLRLLGFASTHRAFTELSGEVLPWTWSAFVFAATTGVLMFVSQPLGYYENSAFRIKIVLLLLAGLNMMVFQLITHRGVSRWDRAASVPLSGKLAGALSLIFWIAIVFFGRRIGFTMSPF